MEEQTSFSDDLRRYLALAWHWAWSFVLAAVLAGAGAYFASTRMTPVYEAVSTVLVNEAPVTIAANYTSIITSQQLAVTYAQLMTKEPVLEGVKQSLGLTGIPDDIIAQPVRDSQLITIRVQDFDPVLAAEVANTLPVVFADQNRAMQEQRFAASKENLKAEMDQINEQITKADEDLAALGTSPDTQAERDLLETTLAQYRQTYASLLLSYEDVRLAEAQSISNIVMVEQAHTPFSPIKPRPLQNTALAAVVGMMVAAGLVFLVEALDDTLKSPEDISEKLGLPILGVIASHKTNGKLITVDAPRSPVSEAFRSLRTNLSYASVDRPLRTLMVTSPSPEDGKSTIAANLSVILAQGGARVAVIDADLRRPRIHHNLGLQNQSGLTSLFMHNRIILNGELQQTGVPKLVAMTSGELPPNPAELVGSEKMQEILKAVNQTVDISVLDSPPLLAVTDAAALSARVDGVLLVLKPGTTKLPAARQAVEHLRRVGANILGIVLNDVELKRSRYRYSYYKNYYYTYYKEYGDGRKVKKLKKESGAGSK